MPRFGVCTLCFALCCPEDGPKPVVVLCFGYCPVRSIFQTGWATERYPQHEADKWGRMRSLRNDVNKALELARGEKLLGSSLEGQASQWSRHSSRQKASIAAAATNYRLRMKVSSRYLAIIPSLEIKISFALHLRTMGPRSTTCGTLGNVHLCCVALYRCCFFVLASHERGSQLTSSRMDPVFSLALASGDFGDLSLTG